MSIPPDNTAPTGRKKLAQGENPSPAGEAAIDKQSPNTSIPEGSKELPKGWRLVTLRGVAAIAGGVTKGQKRRPNERVRNVPYLRVANVQRGYLDLIEVKEIEANETEIESLRLQPGDILFNEGGDRDKLGRGWIWNGELPECVHQNHVFRARLIDPSNDPKFISYYGNSAGQKYFYDQGKHTTNLASINLTKLGALPIPLPSPDEQRRIVAEIEKQFTRLEAGVAALRRVQANLKRYRAAVLKAACEGKLVPTEAELKKSGSGVPPLGSSEKRQDAASTFETGEALLQRILAERRKNWTGRGKYKEPIAPDTANLPQLPEGWTWASVDQLAEETMIGLDRGRAQQSSAPSSGVPYIKMNNVTMEGRVLYDDMAYVPANAEESERFAVQAGDILFNTRNSTELVGKIGIIRNAPDGAIYNNNLMRIRVPRGVLPEFLCSQMCSHGFRQRMELVKKATTSVAAVYQKDLLPLPIALPPIAEQTRIVAEAERRLSVVEELESVVSANLKRAGRLQQSILEKAFTGELV
jgi:type I restriction enzyme S subunit